MSEKRLIVVGVRHHSPACARRVKAVIEAARPAFVLIEGPSDFNPHLPDLRLAHELPLAIFSFHSGPEGSRASYAPFCATSPEWQALESAWALGASPLFCDLPAWHPEFGDRTNRYADPHSARAAAAEAALGRALGEEGQDALWDALAEAAEPDALPERLERYFALLRPEGVDDPREAAREAAMGRYAAWALGEAGGRPVVLVCGGWHADAVRRAAASADGSPLPPPDLPEGERAGSYLVPYSYARLDRFTGYAAGMPSPGYYEAVQAGGLDAAADWAMGAIAKELREAGQVVSTADRIAWASHALALARTRGHPAVLRGDLLDAALATLVKDGLDVAPAWTQAGALAAGSHPALVAMLRALSGTRQGRLAPGTRRPPLVADVEERMRAAGIAPEPRARKIEIDWSKPEERARAHLLHALCILSVPGIERLDGPALAETRAPHETFRIVAHRDLAGALIEASLWGGTLPMAACARLCARVAAQEHDLAALAAHLSQALFAGLIGLDSDLIGRLERGIAQGREIDALGKAGRRIVALYRFGDVFGEQDGGRVQAGLAQLCAALFARVLWRVEAIEDEREGLHAVEALLACRDLARDCPDLTLDRGAMAAALSRRLGDDAAPPGLAGAALGYRIACGAAGADAATGRVRRFGRPERLGDFLAGLFALAREEIGVVHDDAIGSGQALGAIEALVADWTDADFLQALPAMRLAFGWFPPRERERIARALLRRGGLSEAGAEIEALAWMRQRAPLADQAAALAHEARTAERLAGYGLV